MVVDSRTHLPDGSQTISCYIQTPSADLLTGTGMGTQALFGQRFELISSANGLAYGALSSVLPTYQRIDYVGKLPMSAISQDPFNPTHRVSATSAAIFETADIKSRLLGSLPRNAVVEGRVDGDFLALTNDGYIHHRHLSAIRAYSQRSYSSLALDMLNLPYIWGGTGGVGVDCSGLVQSALAATGVDAPRDTDQQEQQLGRSIDFADRSSGDLLFWPGHVGIVIEDDNLLHANAHHMCVAIEPVSQAAGRIGTVRTTKRF